MTEVSIQKSNAFGLGRARTEEIQRVEQQVPWIAMLE